MFIYPYKEGSNSVKNLREKIEELRVIRRENSRFRGNKEKIVINWGCTQLPEEVKKSVVVNNPEAVAIASNKLSFFDKMKDKVQIPEYTTSLEEAKEWSEKGETVVVREVLNGHSGEGIVILENLVEFQDYNHHNAKMYVKYIPKKHEFRIHVSKGGVIDQQRKAVRRDMPPNYRPNFKVRNHHNGFVFVREDVNPDPQVIEQAVLAVAECGLDFGAVDVVWNNFRNKAFVLEVNTAPGLEGTSVETYSEALKTYNLDFLKAAGLVEGFQYEDIKPLDWVAMKEGNPFAAKKKVDEDFLGEEAQF